MLDLQADERVLDVGCGIGARQSLLIRAAAHAQRLCRAGALPHVLVHLSNGGWL